MYCLGLNIHPVMASGSTWEKQPQIQEHDLLEATMEKAKGEGYTGDLNVLTFHNLSWMLSKWIVVLFFIPLCIS